MAVEFNAATDRISYTATSPTDVFAISGWAKLLAPLGSYTSLFRRYTAGGSGRGQIGTDEAGTELTWWTSGVPFGHTLVVDEWFKFGVSCNGANVNLYTATISGPTVSASGSAGNVAGANQITASGISVGSGAEWFPGVISNLRKFSGTLTQAEFETEWQSPDAVRTSGLWGDWNFDVDLLDRSGNGRHFVAGGTPVAFVEGPSFTTPAVGSRWRRGDGVELRPYLLGSDGLVEMG